MKRIATRVQDDPVAILLAAVLLVALIPELVSFRTPLVELVFGLALGLVIGYNLRLVVEKRRP
jgi:NhaP-type Na+/H+ or K+/H+ antiporter